VKYFSLFLLLLAACAQPAKDETAKPAFRALGQTLAVEPTRNDEAIGFEVRRRLDLVGAADTSGITIEVRDGVVTLTGLARTSVAAWRAEAAAHAVKDVKRVVNLVTAP
jgi:osmotically-inducible protein OsmY